MDELFATYSAALTRYGLGGRTLAARRPSPRRPRAPIKAKSLDLLRGLLPAATLTHVGIFASGQAYEQLVLRLLAPPLPEARALRAMILEEIKKVMPSFVARVERPDRGGEWVSYLERGEAAGGAGRTDRTRPRR